MRLGVQCQEKGRGVYTYNAIAQPGSIKGINITDTDFWERVWRENPRLRHAIYRRVPNSTEPWVGNPEEVARAWISQLEADAGHLVAAGLVDLFEGYNEYVHAYQTAQFPDADTFMATEIDEVHARFGGKAHIIVLNAACGHFSDKSNDDGVNIIDAFPKTLAKLNACPKCKLGLHSYDRMNMDRLHLEDVAGGGEGYWLCGRFKRVERALTAAGLDNVRIALTEVGLDAAVDGGGEHRGWRHYGTTIEEAVAHLLDSHNLGWFIPLIEASERVDLASYFGCSMLHDGDNWGDKGFDLANPDGTFPDGLLQGIKSLEPSNGGNGMFPTVININGVTLPEEAARDLVAYHGQTIHQPDVPAGTPILDLVKLEEREGPACYLMTVLNEDGTPWVGIETAWAWTENMGDDDDIGGDNYPTDWQKQADLGPTKEDGTVAPGFGETGWYFGPYEAGPGRAWPRHPTMWAVYITGARMEAGTPHRTLYPTWKVRPKQGEPGPGPDPGPISGIVAELADMSKRLAEIAIALGEADRLADELADML